MLVIYIIASIGVQYSSSKTHMQNQGDYYLRLADYSGLTAATIQTEISNAESLGIQVEPVQEARLELFTSLSKAQGSIGFFMKKDLMSDYSFIVYSQVNLIQNIINGLESNLFTKEEILQRNYQLDDLKQDLVLADYWDSHPEDIVLNPLTVTGVSGLREFLSYQNVFIIAIFVLFMTLDVFLIENAGGTYKVMMTLPHSRWSIYVTKVLAMLMTSFMVIIAASLIRFGVSAIVGGFGNWFDPVVSRENLQWLSLVGRSATPTIISSLEFVLRGIALLTFVMGALVLLFAMVAAVNDQVDQTMFIVLGILLLTFVLGILLQKSSSIHMWYPYMSMFVSDAIQVTKNMNFILSSLLNLALGAICFVIGGCYFAQKDFIDNQ
jgi:ABC-type transport system involved in multi-copper enzyme maturation permease subunit